MVQIIEIRRLSVQHVVDADRRNRTPRVSAACVAAAASSMQCRRRWEKSAAEVAQTGVQQNIDGSVPSFPARRLVISTASWIAASTSSRPVAVSTF